MGKGSLLSESKKAVILLMKKEKKSISKISNEINRSRGVISKILKDPKKYGKNKSPDRPRALSLRTRARVVRLAKGKKITANRIKVQLNLKVNKSTVLRVIKNDIKLSRRRIKRKPILKKIHKKKID